MDLLQIYANKLHMLRFVVYLCIIKRESVIFTYQSRIMFKGKMCIVRGDRSGVFFGEVVEMSADARQVTLIECRRVWYWSGAASISQLATDGTSNPDGCKFPAATKLHLVQDCIEIIAMTEAAIASLQSVEVWSK